LFFSSLEQLVRRFNILNPLFVTDVFFIFFENSLRIRRISVTAMVGFVYSSEDQQGLKPFAEGVFQKKQLILRL
jgi:hypothetical protein